MTSSRAIEYRINRHLAGHAPQRRRTGRRRLVEQLIAVTATASGLLLFGSYMPELVAAGLAASMVWSLGTR
ncbi:hypothetical protein DWB85_03430 [Seongchinamella sediminis]|uniref:Uncharacterized protein n=1 Tax=Seongchinamella sediminis TaxID=2283635 RepID=A0A3L7E3V9_9GAMM|nr:hypothetical protein [Seongchinamella sediminis]RLQ23042.1 hypothetical protein DWB85_03430 [Seongchinamella sediminis]